MSKDSELNTSQKPDVTVQQFSISGPLPVSSEFANYERAFPGAAERILTMAEEEQKLRHELALQQLAIQKSLVELERGKVDMSISAGKAQLRVAGQGQLSIVIITIVLVALTAYAIYARSDVFASLAFVILGLVLHAANLIFPRKKLKDASERDE